MATADSLPQHVLDTRYLLDLSERILPPEYQPPTRDEEEEEETIEKVAYDLDDAAANRFCDCGPDERLEEGFDEDSDRADGWFCSYRSIEGEYKMHVVLERAQRDIEADPGEFSNAIYEEVIERCKLERTKILVAQERKKYANDQVQASSPPPPPPPPCVFPPFSFHHLPPEILVEIALLAQASDPYAHITLSHVDASLRALVNSTPLLWSRIDFLYPSHLVHRFLERSGDVLLKATALPPLHNDHPVLEDVKGDENKSLKEFLRALRPHRHRIHSLRLRCNDLTFELDGENEGQTPAYDFLWDGSMVELELLDLELGVWTWEGMKAFPSSYNIKELHLHGSWTKEYLPLFSSNLKSLVITDDRAPFSKIFDALQAAPRLISLTLSDMSFTGIGEKKGSILNLDHLEWLSLIRIVGRAADALFRCIVPPNLTTLALQLVSILHLIDDLTDINQLQLFPIPQPSVRHLDLTTCDGGPAFFDSIFRTFPGITHLRIVSSNLSDKHLFPLVVGMSPRRRDRRNAIHEEACSNLKHLTIDNEYNGVTEWVKLVAFSRHGSGIPLESVTLRGIPADEPGFKTSLRLEEIIPKLEIAEFDQEVDVYGESEDGCVSETSSEGDWASGDEEIVTARRKVRGAVYDFQ
ncbi:hypothetical protein FRC00_004642 [Tulasnella sp. 408]|nr:hypothetical protein FRC00_004642 [Tulasnella sp. 408]